MFRQRLLLLLLVFPACVYAQEGWITGRVTDSITNEPLAFVNIVYNDAGQGTVTNLEGVFKISRSSAIRYFKLRYVGYHSKTIAYSALSYRNGQLIKMVPEPLDIAEVVVYPGVNPAHRIIKRAAENRNLNNPEKSGPFTYISYDKMVFELEADSSKLKSGDTSAFRAVRNDSLVYGMDRKGKIDIKRFMDKQYLFMMESVSNRRFLSPSKNSEKIIASKISGISQPSFMVIARQFQSFSFYENFVTIANRQFLNPISTGSTDKYSFLIEDTIFTETADTVFIISFHPLKGRNFEGMKGVLYINSDGYAVQNVLAEAYEQKDDKFSVSIQQQYEKVNGVRWFPVLLSTTIRFNPANFGYGDTPVDIVGTGKTYIVNIDFNPKIDPSEFSDVQVEVSPDAHKQSEQVWNGYRVDSLNARETETYRMIDSLGKAEHLDRTIASMETILTGYLPGQYWNFDIKKFIGYNPYEGFRFGLGGRTTQLVSRKFSIGGYLAYGLKDKAFKYGGNVSFNILPSVELETGISYRKDVLESGGIRFNESWTLSGTAFYRDYMIEVMDKAWESEVWLGFRALKYLTVKSFLSHSTLIPTGDYGYSLNNENPQIILTSFDYTEAGVKLKYAFKETFMKSPRGNKFSMGTPYPVFYLNITRGNYLMNGAYEYWRSELKITKVFKTKSFGDTRVALISGIVSGDVPYSRLYAGLGSYKHFGVESEQSFGTMRLNEFLSNRFISLFVKQDLGTLLFRPKSKFQPEIALIHNMGFGSLADASHHENISFKTMEKGYFEGGILINNLVHIQLFKYGLGVMYRYGSYAFPKTIDNFAFKLTLMLNL